MKTSAIDITMHFEHARCGGGNALRYVNDKYNTHTVCRYFHAGEQDFPNVYRHETIEKARATWERVRKQMEAEGYKAGRTEKKSA